MEVKTEEKNIIELKGKVIKSIEFSHESFGEKFYKTEIAVSRLSGELDYININISDLDLRDKEINEGDLVKVTGQIRSYNHYIKKENETKRKLVINVFAKEIIKIDEEELKDKAETNKAILIGFICKKPTFRKTPFGREISDILVAVNRNYKKSDYLPVISWGRNARFASNLEIGDKVKIEGRLQSRIYNKVYDDGTEVEKRAYEISVLSLDLYDEEENEEKISVEE